MICEIINKCVLLVHSSIKKIATISLKVWLASNELTNWKPQALISEVIIECMPCDTWLYCDVKVFRVKVCNAIHLSKIYGHSSLK